MSPGVGDDPRLVRLGRVVAGVEAPPEPCDEEIRTLVRLARRHGLAPMLYERVREAGLPLDQSSPWRPLVVSSQRSAADHVIFAVAQGEINDALSGAEIPTLWLKGFALAHLVYDEPFHRPMADLDLLVPYDSRTEALEICERLGYRRSGPSTYDYRLRGGPARAVVVELHYHLLGAAHRVLSTHDLEWFWSNTVTHRNDEASFRTFDTEAHFLYLVAHAMLQHRQAGSPLRWFLDLDRLVRAPESVRWQCVIDGAARLRWTYAVERALEIARDHFDTPVPDGVLARLRAVRPVDEDTRLVSDGSVPTDRFQWARSQLAGMNGSRRARVIAAMVFPRPDYMRWRYRVRSTWLVPFLYPYRLADIAVASVRSLVRGRRR